MWGWGGIVTGREVPIVLRFARAKPSKSAIDLLGVQGATFSAYGPTCVYASRFPLFAARAPILLLVNFDFREFY